MINNNEEIERWYSEYELRQFIDMAVRWGIDGIYKDRSEGRPFSIFTYFVENARNNYDKFCNQINKKLTKNQQWTSIEIDVKQRFLPMLNQYLEWYKNHKPEFEKFQPYCPYTLMFSIIESTKAEILKYFPEQLQKAKTEQPQPETKPVFKPEYINVIYKFLKDFFSIEQQKLFMEIIKTGNNLKEPLLFLDNGNRLADTFKLLIKNDIITCCEQKELEDWIGRNFKYKYRGVIKNFTPRYLNDIISTTKEKCRKPILNIRVDKENGKQIIIKA